MAVAMSLAIRRRSSSTTASRLSALALPRHFCAGRGSGRRRCVDASARRCSRRPSLSLSRRPIYRRDDAASRRAAISLHCEYRLRPCGEKPSPLYIYRHSQDAGCPRLSSGGGDAVGTRALARVTALKAPCSVRRSAGYRMSPVERYRAMRIIADDGRCATTRVAAMRLFSPLIRFAARRLRANLRFTLHAEALPRSPFDFYATAVAAALREISRRLLDVGDADGLC